MSERRRGNKNKKQIKRGEKLRDGQAKRDSKGDERGGTGGNK